MPLIKLQQPGDLTPHGPRTPVLCVILIPLLMPYRSKKIGVLMSDRSRAQGSWSLPATKWARLSGGATSVFQRTRSARAPAASLVVPCRALAWTQV